MFTQRNLIFILCIKCIYACNIGYMQIHIEYIKISYGCESYKNNLFKRLLMVEESDKWLKHWDGWINVFSAFNFILIEYLFVIFVKYWLYKQEEVYFWDSNICWGLYLLLKFIHRSNFDPQNANHNFRYSNIYNFTWELDALD